MRGREESRTIIIMMTARVYYNVRVERKVLYIGGTCKIDISPLDCRTSWSSVFIIIYYYSKTIAFLRADRRDLWKTAISLLLKSPEVRASKTRPWI